MPRTYTVQDTTTGKEITFDWNAEGEPTEADLQEIFQAAGGGASAPVGGTGFAAPSTSLPIEMLQGAGRYTAGFAKAAVPNPVDIARSTLQIPADQFARATGAKPGDLAPLGLPGGGALDQLIASAEATIPYLGMAIGAGRGMAHGTADALQQGAQGVEAGDSGQVLEALGKGVGTVLPALVGVGGRVPGVGGLAARVEAKVGAGAGNLIQRLRARAAAKSAPSRRPPAAPPSVPGEGTVQQAGGQPVAPGATSPAAGPPSQPTAPPASPPIPTKRDLQAARAAIEAKTSETMRTHVDQFLDDVAKGGGSLEDAGKARGEALAAREQSLRDAFRKDYDDVFEIADENGARPKTEGLTAFIESLNPVERAKLKQLGVQLTERVEGDTLIEPPVDLSFREMHEVRSRALKAVRTLKSGPPDPATGAAKKVATLASEAMEKATASSPLLADIWKHVDGQYRKTFGTRGEFYGTVLKKIAKTTLDAGAPPEKSHRLLYGASLEDVRALKAHLPETDVRRMFRDALQEALVKPDGTLLDPDKMVNALRDPKKFGRDLIREGLGERHEAALDRLVTTLKSKKVDANQLVAQLEERAAELKAGRSAAAKDAKAAARAKFQAERAAARSKSMKEKEAAKAARDDARFQELGAKIEAGDTKLAESILAASVPGRVLHGAKLFFRVMAHPKTSYALARVLEESKDGTLTSAGIWSSKLNDGLREMLQEQAEEEARANKAKGPSR